MSGILAHHWLDELSYEPEVAFCIDRHDFVGKLFVLLRDWLHLHNASIVNENVNVSKLILALSGKICYVLAI